MSPDEITTLVKETKNSGTVYKPAEPALARVVSNEALTPPGDEEWRHIVLNLEGADYDYLEGQSLGVIATGTNEKGKPHRVRLYSIASSRKGEDGNSNTASISVKRVNYEHPETGEKVRGVASNYICELNVGDEVKITGPVGKAFVLPAEKDVDLILLATGTGVAPFLAFLNRVYKELEGYTGKVILYYGVRYQADLAYLNDMNQSMADFQKINNFRLSTAISRENPNQKMYVQHRLQEDADEIWEILKRGKFGIYICGLKGMEKGINETFQTIATKNGADWESIKPALKKTGRWNQEVY